MFTDGSPACDAGVTAATVGGAGVAATTAGGAIGGVITIVMSLVVATLPTSHVRSVAGSVCAMFARCSSLAIRIGDCPASLLGLARRPASRPTCKGHRIKTDVSGTRRQDAHLAWGKSLRIFLHNVHPQSL